MFSDPLLAHVDAGGAETTVPYALTSLVGQASERSNSGASDGEPKKIRISHTKVGKGETARVRHLVRLESYVVEDGVENTNKPVAIYAVADVPNIGVTDAQLEDLFLSFVGLLRGASGDAANAAASSTFFNRWIGGES